MPETPLPDTPDPRVQRVVDFFERLQPQDLRRLDTLYALDARFKDPFNDVRGIADIQAIFEHMFRTLGQPSFTVTERIVQGSQCFLAWQFRFRFRRSGSSAWQSIQGGTHLVFDAHGLISLHRDYWDAAEELYEKLPVLGSLMRWLKRQARA